MSWQSNFKVDWSTQAHHVWPQVIGGKDVGTLPVNPRLHQSGIHTKKYEPAMMASLKNDFPWVDRTSGTLTTRAFGRLSLDEQLEFVAAAKEQLNLMYERVQNDLVKRGDFRKPTEAIVNAVKPESLVGGKKQ